MNAAVAAPRPPRAAGVVARTCSQAVSPDSATTTSLLANSTAYESCRSSRAAQAFKPPVTIRTAKADHAIRAKARAAIAGACGEIPVREGDQSCQDQLAADPDHGSHDVQE